jgi:HNH endonuclease
VARGRKPRSVALRFWEKVTPAGECWLWTGARSHGYGMFMVGSRADGTRRLVPATQIAWLLSGGRLGFDHPSLLHICDNRACVNPDHLFLGRHLENMHDSMGKGQQPGAGKAPPTEAQVAARARFAVRFAG